jgi:hypothetical protein
VDKELAEMILSTNEELYDALSELGDMSTWTQEQWLENLDKLKGEYGEDIEYILTEY